jgi:hypothetical protein
MEPFIAKVTTDSWGFPNKKPDPTLTLKNLDQTHH